MEDILGDGAPDDTLKPAHQNSGSSASSYQPPMQRSLTDKSDTRPEEVVEMGISNVKNPDINVAWQACVQLELVVQTEQVVLLRDREDHLVSACVTQLRLLNSSSRDSTPADLLARGYRSLFLLLMSFFEKTHLAKWVTKKVLHDLVYQLVGLLVDGRLEELESGDLFIMFVNELVMRIVENSDPTNITRAIMKLLRDCVASTNTSPVFTEIVVKCLWRIMQLLPQWEEETDFSLILYDTHLFLKDFPSPVWKKRQSDVPLRTIKNFIQTVTKIKGNRILFYMGRIDNSSDSELHSYIVKLLKNAKQDDVKSTTEEDDKTPNCDTKVPFVQLLDIFKRIGMKNHTREGLELLYSFKERYPAADLDSYLRKASPQFQDYIAKGLKSIEMERKKEQHFMSSNAVIPGEGTVKDTEVSANHKAPRVLNAVDVDGDGRPASKDAQYYLPRLQVDAGLKPANNVLDSTLRQQATGSDNNIPNDGNLNVRMLKENRSKILLTSRSGADGIERLRKRLEALKSATRSPVSSYQPPKQRSLLTYPSCASPEEVIQMRISNVINPDINVAWQACEQLEVVVQTEQLSRLRGREDHLVLACVMQLQLLNSSSPHSTPADLLARGYRKLFLLLKSFFENSPLAKRVSKKVLHDLVNQLLGLLVDRNLEELESGDSFVGVVNYIVMSIIENSDPTNITSVMMKSLYDCVASTNTSPVFTEIVMKCLWKIIKLLPQWEEETDFAIILYDIHLFLKDFPSPEWKKRQSDAPLRTIKTLIHTVTKIKGNRILNYMGRHIHNASVSELHFYLIKILKNEKQDDVKSSTEKDVKIPNRHTKVPYVQLSEIFEKIGMKNHTREGLELLYSFKEQYPDANLDYYLRKASPQFQDYIAKGLKSIEIERKKEQRFIPSNAVFPGEGTVKDTELSANHKAPRVLNAVDVDGDGRTASKDAQYYLPRLQVDAGLKPANNVLDSTLRQQTTGSGNNIPNDENLNVRILKENRSKILQTTRSGAGDFERLRKRLEAYKSATK